MESYSIEHKNDKGQIRTKDININYIETNSTNVKKMSVDNYIHLKKHSKKLLRSLLIHQITKKGKENRRIVKDLFYIKERTTSTEKKCEIELFN